MLTVTGLISVFQLLVATCYLVLSRGISALTRRSYRVRVAYTRLYGTPSGRAFVSKASIDEGLCTELHDVRLLVRTDVPLAAFNWTDVRTGIRIGGCSSYASANFDPLGVVSRYCCTDGGGLLAHRTASYPLPSLGVPADEVDGNYCRMLFPHPPVAER